MCATLNDASDEEHRFGEKRLLFLKISLQFFYLFCTKTATHRKVPFEVAMHFRAMPFHVASFTAKINKHAYLSHL